MRPSDRAPPATSSVATPRVSPHAAGDDLRLGVVGVHELERARGAEPNVLGGGEHGDGLLGERLDVAQTEVRSALERSDRHGLGQVPGLSSPVDWVTRLGHFATGSLELVPPPRRRASTASRPPGPRQRPCTRWPASSSRAEQVRAVLPDDATLQVAVAKRAPEVRTSHQRNLAVVKLAPAKLFVSEYRPRVQVPIGADRHRFEGLHGPGIRRVVSAAGIPPCRDRRRIPSPVLPCGATPLPQSGSATPASRRTFCARVQAWMLRSRCGAMKTSDSRSYFVMRSRHTV
jgi:hypothetical protein